MINKKFVIIAAVALAVLAVLVISQWPKVPEVVPPEEKVVEEPAKEEVPPEEVRIIGHKLWEYQDHSWDKRELVEGNIKINILGHSSILIESVTGKRILIDPSLAMNITAPEKYKTPEGLGKIDYILITHPHMDHFNYDEAKAIYDMYEPVVIAQYGLFRQIVPDFPKAVPMTAGGAWVDNNIIFRMVQAVHSADFMLKGELAYGGAAVGYVIEFENGYTVYDSGDTAPFSGMRDIIGNLYKPDLYLVPYSSVFTMNLEEAAYSAYLVGAPTVIPHHYGFMPILPPDPSEFVKYMAEHYPQFEVLTPKIGEWLTL